MPAQWFSNAGDWRPRITAMVSGALIELSRPERVMRLRQLLVALFALWLVVALARMVWSLLPVVEPALPEPVVILNPARTDLPAASGKETMPLAQMVAWHLFGEAGVDGAAPLVMPEPEVAERAGIERGARETRLDLKLRGIVASTEDGLGHAIIEYKSQQDVYAVDDKLPVPGQVVLAKVMPHQVVLDHGGTYELLTLFDESGLDVQLPAQTQVTPPAVATPSSPGLTEQAAATRAALASSYRQRLYDDPQSLAQVVRVSAVREDGQLLGYRIGPGRDASQFAQLGFRDGDLVTAINGFELSDPANTVRLYQAMRSAGEAVFNVQRNGQSLTVSVNMDSQPARQ